MRDRTVDGASSSLVHTKRGRLQSNARRETNRNIRNPPRIDTEALRAFGLRSRHETRRQNGKTYPNIKSQIRCTVLYRRAVQQQQQHQPAGPWRLQKGQKSILPACFTHWSMLLLTRGPDPVAGHKHDHREALVQAAHLHKLDSCCPR